MSASQSAHDAPPPQAVPVKRESMLTTLLELRPYMWPAERPDLRFRVIR